MRQTLLAFLLLCFSFPALAMIDPEEKLSDPALEVRARAIAADIRCPVCESQNIENSNADVARDLRLLIRERLVAGDSDAEIIAYLRERYGDSILLNPPVQQNTLLLWLGPLAILILGGLGAVFFIRKAAA